MPSLNQVIMTVVATTRKTAEYGTIMKRRFPTAKFGT
jgi:hypothetical protein